MANELEHARDREYILMLSEVEETRDRNRELQAELKCGNQLYATLTDKYADIDCQLAESQAEAEKLRAALEKYRIELTDIDRDNKSQYVLGYAFREWLKDRETMGW